MIKSLTSVNCYGDTVKIVLADDEPSHGLIIKSIDGLGPAKANINTSTLATLDGAYFNTSRLDTRNVVIEFVFYDYGSIENYRLNSYKYFPIKQYVDLAIETNNRKAVTRGYVESNEPEIFSDMEGTQVSIICPDSLLYSSEVTTYSGTLGDGSSTGQTTEIVINNSGDVETGMVVTFEMTDETTEGPGKITMENLTTGTEMVFDCDYFISSSTFGSSVLTTGDIIKISSEKMNKKVLAKRSYRSSFSSVLNAVEQNTDWVTLAKGDNRIRFTLENAFTVSWTLTYTAAYEGV